MAAGTFGSEGISKGINEEVVDQQAEKSKGLGSVNAGRLGCAVLVMPFVELFVLLWAASVWGWQPVVMIVVVTGVIGLIVMRIGVSATGRSLTQALRTLQQQREDRTAFLDDAPRVIEASSSFEGSSRMPTPPAQTMLLIPAGMALAVPGFISDVIGVGLLVPTVRRRIADRWAQRLGPI